LATLVKAATSPDRVHEILLDTLPASQYFRFQPVDDAFQCELDETDEIKLQKMQEAARLYTNEHLDQFIRLCDILKHDRFSDD
jgi:hypothetical protein